MIEASSCNCLAISKAILPPKEYPPMKYSFFNEGMNDKILSLYTRASCSKLKYLTYSMLLKGNDIKICFLKKEMDTILLQTNSG